MRLTVNLDPGVYSFMSAFAGAKGISLSAAVNELVQRAEGMPEFVGTSPKIELNPYGYLEIVEVGPPLTPDKVKQASEDELV